METTQEQPQLNKEEPQNPPTIQLQAIVIVNTTVVHGEHCVNGATSSGETNASSGNNFTSNHNLFTESTDTNKKRNTLLSWKKFVYILAIVLTICVISGLFLCPTIFYIMRDTFNFKNNENFNDTPKTSLREACNISVWNTPCTRAVMSTYNALKSESRRTSLHCLNRTQELFCDALSECNDMSYVRGLMCQEVRQEHCTAEWRRSESNRNYRLFNCDEYGETATLNCSDQFGLDDHGSICSPLCKDFSQEGKTATTVSIATYAIAHFINVIGGIIVLIAAYKNRKNMFRYPQVLLVINTILMTILSSFVSFPNITMGAWNPFCSNKFLQKVENNPNTFCKLQGFIIFTVLTMYSLFWLIYILRLLLVLIYPLPSSRVYKLIRNRKIQIMEVACVLIVSVIPNVVLATSSQFHVSSYPPVSCGASTELTFYGCVIPTTSTNFISLIIMLFVLHKIHSHTKSRDQMAKGKSCVSTPEVKILILLCYLIVLNAFLWVSITIFVSTSEEFLYNIREYMHCLAGGVRNGLDCSEFRRNFEAMNYKYFEVANVAMYAFLNLTILPLVLSYRAAKKSVKKFLSTMNIT